MKILLIGEYSGLHKELRNALRAQGHDVTLAAASDFWKKFDADINLGHGENIYSYKARQLLLPFVKLRMFQGYDVVHVVNFYVVPRLPYLNLLFFRYLKLHNKVVTLSGSGDDPFFVKYSEQTMRYSPIPWHEKYDRGGPYYMRGAHHLKAMHACMKYIDGVIPIMFEYYSTFCAAGYAEKVARPIPIPIDAGKIKYSESDVKAQKLVLFHGLNRRGFKGTFLIEKSFEDLKERYPNDVECIIKGHMPFEVYLDVLSRTHVSVDQVFSYSLAMNALYSMAQGKVVAGGAEQESSILYGDVLPPVYNLLPEQQALTAVLERIIEERETIPERSHASREFVLRHHAPSVVAGQYISYWQGLL
ncbi:MULTISPECIES: hypothetical protein [unclassified Pseudomonas]|uniref:glycosyltransferase n=1 Tax=unclassified Pseudomonas TaxID=196821 RepID=UPI00244BC6A4|nr:MULTISPECIES: hypothetical protein [unclassified Pseudomonas]MDH0304893.1 hypothetical protein [Pseudomonas sp. GD04091]MDH1988267.1 hypothetical protein [Pseudomonas sp. GD03689]